MDDFGREFSAAWSALDARFLKLECWQSYLESAANLSQAAFDDGDVAKAGRLLAEEAEYDRPLYDDVRRKHIEYARVRLVQQPLSRYLHYEFMGLEVRESMGERIEIVVVDPDVRLPNDGLFDCLLFDDAVALVHDYGTDGRQRGGWMVTDAAILTRLETMVVTARDGAVPMREFLPGHR
jgi:hypothetical protein